MDIRNCKRCKRLFNYTDNARFCPACVDAIEQEFQEAKEYIYKHPGVGIQAISEELDIEVAQIKQWIREERLVLSDASDSGITCESCGANITTGRFCEKCKSQLTNSLSGAITRKEAPAQPQKTKKSEKDRMRFLDSK
jgi:flagellar operon protein (TIGR03826 family)